MENLNESTVESTIDKSDFLSFLKSKDIQKVNPSGKDPSEVDVIDINSDEEQDEVSILLSETKDTCEESYSTTEESCHDDIDEVVEIILSSDSEEIVEETVERIVESRVSSSIKSLTNDISKLDREADNIDDMFDETRKGLNHLAFIIENNNLSVGRSPMSQDEDSLNLSIDILDDIEADNGTNEEDDLSSVFVLYKDKTWCPGKVECRSDYSVTVTIQSSAEMVVVRNQEIASFHPPKSSLTVGTRCIASIDEVFKSGVIIESPKKVNKERYLVFFDEGPPAYVYHGNVRIIEHQPQPVWEDVPPSHQIFLNRYLTKYPENPMSRFAIGDKEKVECGGKWWSTVIKDVDCSLVLVCYEKDGSSEWLFRGSERLGSIFTALKSIQVSPTSLSRAKRNINNNKSIIEYLQTETDKKIFAKKSTGKRKLESSAEENLPNKSSDTIATGYEGSIHQVTEPSGIYLGEKFKTHKCSARCVSKKTFNFNASEEKICGNILLVPLQWGWRRQIVMHSNKGMRKVCYVAPCGRRLRKIEEVHQYLSITKLKMEIDFFSFEWWLHVLDEFKPVKEVQIRDLSYGKENVKISVVNTVDDQYIEHMDYSTHRLPQDGVNIIQDPEFLTCCDCQDDCVDKKKCACRQLTITSTKGEKDNLAKNDAGYEFRRLKEVVLTGIYECNSRCKCSKTCLNRVVQNPIRTNLQVFKTSNRGWGLRTLTDIPSGTFICLYVGNLYNGEEGNRVGKNFGDEYFADLDMIEVVESSKVMSDEDSDEGVNVNESSDNDESFSLPNTKSSGWGRKSTRKRLSKKPNENSKVKSPKIVPPSTRLLFGVNEESYIMDAKKTGNVGRYLNHSCYPNVFVQNVFVDSHDLRFPWISFFTCSFVKAGQELCWDYNYEVGSIPDKVIHCNCGSETCRGRLL